MRSLAGPRAKTSRRPLAQETAAGAEVRWPPSDSQPRQLTPSYHLWSRAPSPPVAKTSSRPADQDATLGAEASAPANDSQLLHTTNFCWIRFHSSGAFPSYPSAHMPLPRRLARLTRSYFKPSDWTLS